MKANLTYEYADAGKFSMVGIACHVKEYRFCWLLNSQLGIELVRLQDLAADAPGAIREQAFPIYYCKEPHRDEEYYLVGNNGANGKLLNRFGQADYFLFVRELVLPGGEAALISAIRKINHVLTAFSIPVKDPYIAAILEDIELLLMEYRIKTRTQITFPKVGG
jgi:hypothetical protein